MEPAQTDLLQEFSHMTRTFEQLSRRLTDVAEQVRTAGILPPDTIIEEMTTSRRSFLELRNRALELVALYASSPTKPAEDIDTMKDLEALLQLVVEAQRKKAAEEKTRVRALTVLDRILSLIHRERPDFAPLTDAHARARLLRDEIRAHQGPDQHPDVLALSQGRHPLAELLTLVEGHEDLDDDLWLLLKHAVAEQFGKSLALSAARGKLCPAPNRMAQEHGAEAPNGQKSELANPAFTLGEAGT